MSLYDLHLGRVVLHAEVNDGYAGHVRTVGLARGDGKTWGDAGAWWEVVRGCGTFRAATATDGSLNERRYRNLRPGTGADLPLP